MNDLDRLLEFDSAWRKEIQHRWLRLMEIAVWGDLQGRKIGAITRLRKRVLDCGEKWRSLFNERDWIPQHRERLKNALASALNLRDSLVTLGQAAVGVGGADHPELERLLAELNRAVDGPLRERENRWAEALDGLNRPAPEGAEE